jgi:hypothetical protein
MHCVQHSVHKAETRVELSFPEQSVSRLGIPSRRSAIQTSLSTFDFVCMFVNCSVDPHSPVGVATSYGFVGPRIESLWSGDLPHPSRVALGPTQTLYSGYRLIPGGKAVCAWR